MSAICDAHKKKVGVELLYKCTGNSVGWGSDELEIRCGRENPFWAPRPSVEQPRRTRKKRGYDQKCGGQYVAVLFGLQLPLTHNPFK